MLWLNEQREQIKKENPGIKVTEIAKKGGEMWREMKDKSIWEEKAAKDKERYNNEMKNYKPSGEAASGSKKRKKESVSPKKASIAASMGGSGFKSKEYISDEDSSSGNSDGDKKKSKKKRKVTSHIIHGHLQINIRLKYLIFFLTDFFFVRKYRRSLSQRRKKKRRRRKKAMQAAAVIRLSFLFPAHTFIRRYFPDVLCHEFQFI